MSGTAARLLVLFGDQLFSKDRIGRLRPDAIFMAESDVMCRRYRYHRHKLVLVLSAMRSKADELREEGFEVHYRSLEKNEGRSFTSMLSEHLSGQSYRELVHFETESFQMTQRLDRLCAQHGAKRLAHESPKFLTTNRDFADFVERNDRLSMADFYRWQRTRLNVLLDEEGKPTGGKWSFDAENRKKLPRDLEPPPLYRPSWTEHTRSVTRMVDAKFPEHPGEAGEFWLPTTEAQAEAALSSFLQERFACFGDYEDALSSEHATIFHSVSSPLLNVGLLTPDRVLEAALHHASESSVPLNSLEGFVRQVIGWREFIRGMWHTLPASHWKQNFWNHDRRLTGDWYQGTTGIPPLDDAIRRASGRAYNHHIERLMVLGNAMVLCRIEPRSAYRWFMEMYADSADWVMAPNLYGMALFSEGGAFTTKPYVCGSNYWRKMSDYPKGPWCDVVDGLYWSFVDAHRDFFERNPRTKMMVGALDRMGATKRERIFALAEELIESKTTR